MQRIIKLYKNAYGGLSEEVWMLSVVMLINRAGSMVLPFLSIYLTQSLGYGIKEAGILLAVYGMGAMAGSLAGGWLSDRVGNFWVQFLSLTAGGLFFLLLPEITRFEFLLPALFLASLVVECLRPANTASVASFSRPENVTRSFSLNRMAINLGFSIGPALGGLLASHSYKLLFYADGLTCISAGIFFFVYFKKRTPRTRRATALQPLSQKSGSPYRDVPFVVFVLLTCCYAVIFFQLFNTLPIYYREAHQLTEGTIGLLLGLNGLIVFLFEMILVNYLEQKVSILRMIVIGTLICGFSFVVLNFSTGLPLLVVAMILLSFSEILAMPFMVTYVIRRAGEGKQGAYIGFYSLAWASAFMLSPYLGTRLIASAGFSTLWWLCAASSLLVALLYYFNLRSPRLGQMNYRQKLMKLLAFFAAPSR
ncbi:MAG: MFS transporter [Cyclobacteriaceae bacterium]